MKPRGPLMIEHRLIEKVLKIAERKAGTMTEHNYDPVTVDTIVDFIRVYADRTHHGKEEDILFAELAKKGLDEKNAARMAELVDEHRRSREKVRELISYNNRFREGDTKVVENIKEIISWLTSFYPQHIRHEDDEFFPDTERYFTPDELDAMLLEFQRFDSTMIHEKYRKVYDLLNG